MVLRNESPKSAVLRLMPVVPHRPVVILLESIRMRRLAIDDKLPVIDVKIVALINGNDAFVKSYILRSELNGNPFLGDPYRAVIVDIPSFKVLWIMGE